MEKKKTKFSIIKKISFMLFISCIGFNTYGQIQEETFNGASLPTGWSASTSPSGCDWQFGYTGSIPGSGFTTPASFASGGAIFIDDGCADHGYTVELEGPIVDLVAASVTSAAIDLVYNHQTFSGSGEFMVEVWDGSVWQNVLTVSDDSPASNTATNATVSIDVSTHINSQFKVKFVYDDENSLTFSLGIDDYKLQNTATASIDDLTNLGFSYYPNPVNNNELNLHAKEEILSIDVYNIIGQRVISKKPAAIETKLNLQHLSDGVYIINVTIGEKRGSFKVIKQ